MDFRWMIPGIVSLALFGQGPAASPPNPPAQERKVDSARLDVSPGGWVKIPSMGPREKKTLVYTFKNISPAPITLRAVDLAPGVTVDGAALHQPIAAGASAMLTMTIDATDWVGWQRRNVRLVTDDPRQGEYFLPVEMVVRPDLTVDAERKGFGEIGSFETPQLLFRFTRETGDPTQVRLVSKLPDYLESEMEPVKNTIEFRLIFHPEKVAPGVALGLETLQLETNAPHQPKFTLYADWALKRTVEAVPARIVFLDKRKTTSLLKLKRRDGKPFAIDKAEVEGEGFSVQAVSTGLAVQHQLQVRRTAPAETKAMLSIRCKGEPEVLKVPLAYLPGK